MFYLYDFVYVPKDLIPYNVPQQNILFPNKTKYINPIRYMESRKKKNQKICQEILISTQKSFVRNKKNGYGFFYFFTIKF